MKPTMIYQVLDLALEARKKGEIFNPLFTGHAGLGKSAICQSWVKKQRERNENFGFIDLRIAYLEGPDLIGLPVIIDAMVGGKSMKRTLSALPDFWPTEGEGLLLLEEPNRGNTAVLNCLMQVLTDRKVHNYGLPEGWIIASAINPDSAEYDVNSMDAALRDRFEEFEIEYGHQDFLDYIEDHKWSESIEVFVKQGMWIYKTPEAIGDKGHYVSPRTWSKLNAAEVAGLKSNRALHRITCYSVLGKNVGNEYHKFCYDEAPVMAQDLVGPGLNAALKKLKQQSDPNNYKGELISATIESIVKAYGGEKAKADEIDEKTLVEVLKIIPADQGLNLIKECALKVADHDIPKFFKSFMAKYPELTDILKSSVRIVKNTNSK